MRSRLLVAISLALACRVHVASALTRAQTPTPPAAPQNPSPMVEETRAHERLTPRELDGVTRSFGGPAEKQVEVFVSGAAHSRDVVDLVIHFHGAAWLPEQAAAQAGGHFVPAGLNPWSRFRALPSTIRRSGGIQSILCTVTTP